MRIAVHHSAVKRTKSMQIWGVNNYHRSKWGMKSMHGWYVGYNYFCDTNGKLTNTRKVGEETIANKGHNCDAPERCDIISFCFALDGNVEFPNTAQIKTFQDLYWQVSATRKQPEGLPITLHRDIQVNRTCPGALITIEYLKGLLEDNSALEEAEKAAEIAALQRKLTSMWATIQYLLRLLTRK